MHKKVLIVDFGSQYTQLIARVVRSLSIYCEIYSYNAIPDDLETYGAVIFSGSPFSIYSENAPAFDISKIKKPLLGICYGAQYIAHAMGGEVHRSKIREFGRSQLNYVKTDEVLFKNISKGNTVWMSHSDSIEKLPQAAIRLAGTENIAHAGYRIKNKDIYAVQFHPEAYHTEGGRHLFHNFLIDIAKINPNWEPDSYIKNSLEKIKKTINKEKVILGLSGGVDSSVAAVLLHRSVGKQLYCIFVNNGLLRKNEFEIVLGQYKEMGLNIKGVDASQEFLNNLKGVTLPEEKRKIIGKTFIAIFNKEAKRIKGVKWLAQGTIYPDVIESGSVKGPSSTIKSHHNVGGLPEIMSLKLIEPLRMLFKDEVRLIGYRLKISESILKRHPFPGPGLAIRILGEVTPERVKLLQEVDAIFIEELKKHRLYYKIWQAAAVLLPIKSVGVMGDERTYENCVALRAVESIDGMTADWANLPYTFLQKISNKIINKVPGVNRIVYDISSKPPATIEWE